MMNKLSHQTHQKKFSSKNLPALFIGRFQPFHLGHLNAIQEILKKEQRIIIAIGSAQYHYQSENPFTASERMQMIEAGLKDVGVLPQEYRIIPVWNIEDEKKWPLHIDSTIPPYGAIYTGSTIVKSLYEKFGKHEIKPVKFYGKISGTLIRKNIAEEKKWENMVPPAVAKLLKKWKTGERLKHINSSTDK